MAAVSARLACGGAHPWHVGAPTLGVRSTTTLCDNAPKFFLSKTVATAKAGGDSCDRVWSSGLGLKNVTDL